MIHKHIKSLPHHPKRVIIISLIVAIAIGTFGYIEINKKIENPEIIPESNSIIRNSSVNNNLTLGFLSGGRIKSVLVKAGDTVKSGQVLASLDSGNTLGALSQAKAAYKIAEANYQKILNGATGTAIDVAKSIVNTAQVNLDGITKQQNLLVENAHRNFLNSSLVAKIDGGNSSLTPPSISGIYDMSVEGEISLNVYQTGDGDYFNVSGVTTGAGKVSTTNPESIGDSGLFIKFPSSSISYAGSTWKIEIPNKSASNYLTNYNAYLSSLQTQSQAIASAQATLDQANASLVALVSSAREEDVAVAQAQVDNALGAVQIAEAAYKNTIITAPTDGTILSVSITPGQIAIQNAPAIEFISNVSN